MAATETPSAKACNEACVACREEEEQQPTHPAARGRKVTGMLEVTAVHIAAVAEAAARAASQTTSTEGAEPEEGATGYPWMQGVGDLHVELEQAHIASREGGALLLTPHARGGPTPPRGFTTC